MLQRSVCPKCLANNEVVPDVNVVGDDNEDYIEDDDDVIQGVYDYMDPILPHPRVKPSDSILPYQSGELSDSGTSQNLYTVLSMRGNLMGEIFIGPVNFLFT